MALWTSPGKPGGTISHGKPRTRLRLHGKRPGTRSWMMTPLNLCGCSGWHSLPKGRSAYRGRAHADARLPEGRDSMELENVPFLSDRAETYELYLQSGPGWASARETCAGLFRVEAGSLHPGRGVDGRDRRSTDRRFATRPATVIAEIGQRQGIMAGLQCAAIERERFRSSTFADHRFAVCMTFWEAPRSICSSEYHHSPQLTDLQETTAR
jgi:hypothetical protein